MIMKKSKKTVSTKSKLDQVKATIIPLEKQRKVIGGGKPIIKESGTPPPAFLPGS